MRKLAAKNWQRGMTRLEVDLVFRCFRATIFFEWKREQWPFGGHIKGYQEDNRQNEVRRVGIMDETFAADTELDNEPIEAEPQNNDLTLDPFILGGAMVFAYEEGLRERKRRRRKKLSDDSE
jgi:hypothetical protein